MDFFRKLLIGKVSKTSKKELNPIRKVFLNIRSVWNNDHEDDNGLEKIFRLFLTASQMLFPGIYIKYFASKIGNEYKDITMDFYILAKVIFPLLILKNNWQTNDYMVFAVIYLLLETVLYIPTLIFASDLFARPRSYKRSMLLLFLNYFETVFSFAVLYRTGNYLNQPLTHWFDAVYHSFVTASTIGYGDYYPVTIEGKCLAIMQVLQFLLFIVLFLNFFTSKIKTKGYFQDEKE